MNTCRWPGRLVSENENTQAHYDMRDNISPLCWELIIASLLALSTHSSTSSEEEAAMRILKHKILLRQEIVVRRCDCGLELSGEKKGGDSSAGVPDRLTCPVLSWTQRLLLGPAGHLVLRKGLQSCSIRLLLRAGR